MPLNRVKIGELRSSNPKIAFVDLRIVRPTARKSANQSSQTRWTIGIPMDVLKAAMIPVHLI